MSTHALPTSTSRRTVARSCSTTLAAAARRISTLLVDLPVQGPPFIRLSERVVKYDPDDVRRWLARHRVDTEAAA